MNQHKSWYFKMILQSQEMHLDLKSDSFETQKEPYKKTGVSQNHPSWISCSLRKNN